MRETDFILDAAETFVIANDALTDVWVHESFPLPSYVLDIKTYRDDTEAFYEAAKDRYKGAYNPLVPYSALEIVTYNGSSYIATDNVSAGVIPPAGVWELLAQKGDTGDDGWAVPIQRITHAGGALTVNYGAGKTVHLIVNGPTSLSFTGWPPDTYLARLTLLIVNPAGHLVTFPNGIRWSGSPPVVSEGDDWYAVTTLDGGATVYGHTIGQAYEV